MTTYRPETAAAMAALRRRFPVKANGLPATFIWDRGGRPPANRFEPQHGSRSSRRADLVNWCIWSYHAALGDSVTVRTLVASTWKRYELRATPAEGRAYLEALASDDPACFLFRGCAKQWLTALDKAEDTLGRSLSRPVVGQP